VLLAILAVAAGSVMKYARMRSAERQDHQGQSSSGSSTFSRRRRGAVPSPSPSPNVTDGDEDADVPFTKQPSRPTERTKGSRLDPASAGKVEETRASRLEPTSASSDNYRGASGYRLRKHMSQQQRHGEQDGDDVEQTF
jgi:hypothetical protein